MSTIEKQDPKTAVARAYLPASDIAGIGGSMPKDGLYPIVSEFTKFETKQGRTKAWVNLNIQDGDYKGEVIFDYVNIPKVGDKPAAVKFFRRCLVSLGFPAEKVKAQVSTSPDKLIEIKGTWFDKRPGMIWFFAPDREKNLGAEIVYLLADEAEKVKSGELVMKRMGGPIDKKTTKRDTGTSTAAADIDDMDEDVVVTTAQPDNGAGSTDDDINGLLM